VVGSYDLLVQSKATNPNKFHSDIIPAVGPHALPAQRKATNRMETFLIDIIGFFKSILL